MSHSEWLERAFSSPQVPPEAGMQEAASPLPGCGVSPLLSSLLLSLPQAAGKRREKR